MAPASRAVAVVALSLLYLCGGIISSEFFSTLTLFNNELHKQGCSSLSEWEDYAADCGKLSLYRCLCIVCHVLPGTSVIVRPDGFMCLGVVLCTDSHTPDYKSSLLQSDPELVSAIYGRGIAYGKKSLQVSDGCNAWLQHKELGDFESAMESFQKALMLNQNHIQSLQLRGMMLYHHGSLQEAIGNFKYMKGLSHVAMGQFYEGIKAQTKVMLNDPLLGQKASSEYLKVKYLRDICGWLNFFFSSPEYSRYLHSHLDIPVAEYNVDQDLPGNFKNHWAKNLPFLIEDYEEQPGLQPHIKDVLPQNFDSYSTEVQKLICTADHLGALMQYDTPGFLPNRRIHRGSQIQTSQFSG
ncbi:hypothetical protein GOODEAATRI_012639 [Goodea atripinnis]|uniref:Tetratricopeptide repeat domain 13 n=1 Tax=Goodea atripinnis TaxID=208336 RepID=A0ABV0N0W1_9TELE